MYGFVLGDRLNLVMQDESLSVCDRAARRAVHVHVFIVDAIAYVGRYTAFMMGVCHGKHRRCKNAYRVHLASFPLLLQGRDFDVA